MYLHPLADINSMNDGKPLDAAVKVWGDANADQLERWKEIENYLLASLYVLATSCSHVSNSMSDCEHCLRSG